MIYASLSAFGATGPYQEYPGNGGTTEPMSGLSSVHGYEGDQGMNTGGMIPDPVSGYFIVSCILAAINNSDNRFGLRYLEFHAFSPHILY